MELKPYRMRIRAVQSASGGQAEVQILVKATDRKTAEEITYNLFMQGAGPAVQAALPQFHDLHVEAEEA